MKMRKVKWTVAVMAILVIVWNLTALYVDMQLQKEEHTTAYSGCHKIWTSRGLYHSHAEQNSVTALKRAFDAGALGAEFDFAYDVKKQDYFISHGHPKKDAEGNYIYPKKDGQILSLEHLMTAVGAGHYFWYDYKNLEHMDDADMTKAIIRLKEITQQGGLRERVYIEASNPLALQNYTHAGFKTILGIHPLPESNIFSSIVVTAFKMAYYFTDITALAMPYGKENNPIYGPKTQEELKGIPVFLFHVPNKKALLSELIEQKDVRVILVGRDKSIDRFDITGCRK